MAKQPDGSFALFDDLSVRFIATKLRMGEAAALLRRISGLSPEHVWREIEAAHADIPVGAEEPDPESLRSRIDDLLIAVSMIRGRRFLNKELCAMGIPRYEPKSEPSEAILDLCDCYITGEAG
ncbi:hypothetical protein [Rhizobium lusitanum]|uniref:hypothetical protein n=1 Tax=Rhizobium lusitanum TaxID=293958 RepID=UPI001574E20D|nr:hypothetical protein [Rhizobium lusitanum]NTJ11773.1 hypothetical protein [Rhizobium lusitanum]